MTKSTYLPVMYLSTPESWPETACSVLEDSAELSDWVAIMTLFCVQELPSEIYLWVNDPKKMVVR